jgi:hypothetical protein
LAERFQRRRLKCEKLMDDGHQVMAKAHTAFFRFSMFLSLSPNSLYRQTTDCTEGGGLMREHCIYIYFAGITSNNMKLVEACLRCLRTIFLMNDPPILLSICCCVNFGFSFA